MVDELDGREIFTQFLAELENGVIFFIVIPIEHDAVSCRGGVVQRFNEVEQHFRAGAIEVSQCDVHF